MNQYYNKILKIIDKEIDLYIKTSGILTERKKNEIHEYIRGIITYAYRILHLSLNEYIYISSKLADFYKYDNYLVPNKQINMNEQKVTNALRKSRKFVRSIKAFVEENKDNKKWSRLGLFLNEWTDIDTEKAIDEALEELGIIC